MFAGANFIRADLSEVTATNADFTEAVIDRYQTLALCERASGTNPYTGGEHAGVAAVRRGEAVRGVGRGGEGEGDEDVADVGRGGARVSAARAIALCIAYLLHRRHAS